MTTFSSPDMLTFISKWATFQQLINILSDYLMIINMDIFVYAFIFEFVALQYT